MKGHGGMSRAAYNNRCNQMNSNNPAFHSSRGFGSAACNNRSNQLNPNNPSYNSSRGLNTSGSSLGAGYSSGGYSGVIPVPPQEFVPIMTNEDAWKAILKSNKDGK